MSSINNATYITELESQAEDGSTEKSLESQKQPDESLSQLLNTLHDKSNNLPVPYEFNRAVSVSGMFSDKYQATYSEENYEKSSRELAMVMLGLVVFVFLCIIGWGVSKEINFLNGGDFVYNTGLIGGILMLLTFVHSFVKRSLYLGKLINSTYSYYFHVICGACGALLIVMHSNFDFRSINSSVAVASMAVVIIAGAMGRYLYTQFTLSLHRLYLEIKEFEPELYANISVYNSSAAERVRERLSKFALRIFKQPSNIFSYLIRCFTLVLYATYTYLISMFGISRLVRKASKSGDIEKQNVKKIKTAHKQELRSYIYLITMMGGINLLEQVFRHWRVLHVPFLYMLAVTAIVHVVVVHMY